MSDSKKKPYWLLVLAAVILICIPKAANYGDYTYQKNLKMKLYA